MLIRSYTYFVNYDPGNKAERYGSKLAKNNAASKTIIFRSPTKTYLCDTNNRSHMNTAFNRNEDWMKLAVSQSRQYFEKIKLGGG